MIWASVVILVVVGIGVILQRNQLAHLQSMLGGGNVAPGCVVAEAVALFLFAALVLVAYRAGLFGAM